MENPDDAPTPPDDIDEPLIQQVNSLDLAELKSLHSYIEQRIETLRTPIEERIEETAAGEVLQIEPHGTSALVRKHPPNADGSGAYTDIVSLYHVRQEPHPDGTTSLHWAYLGDVSNSEQIRCSSCGGALDASASTCPHCGSNNPHHPETDE